MSKVGSVAFVGKSGHRYEFGIYPLDVHLKADHAGVYVVTARKDDEHSHHSHHMIFIGETEDLSTVLVDHPEQAAFDAEGANCICIHPTQDAAARVRIKEDILAQGKS